MKYTGDALLAVRCTWTAKYISV